MRKLIITAFYSILGLSAFSQSTPKVINFNSDFEKNNNGKPLLWENYGDNSYKYALDSVTKRNGKYSTFIEFVGKAPSANAWTCVIPANYHGEKITLTGYIKTENVSEGWAGFWLRIDPNVAFVNMENKGVVGTTDWTKYELTLPMNPEKTKKIVFGGLLAGKGKMWMDDLTITIDGKNIQTLQPYIKEFKADKDTALNGGSRIDAISLTEQKTKELYKLGLVWGFLKYYHPQIAAGNYNWDYELFRMLPKYMDCKNAAQCDAFLTNWITNIGTFETAEKPDTAKVEVKLSPDLDWITNSGLSPTLSAQLIKIKNAARTNSNYYIELADGVGNPEFKNENDYKTMKYPDAGFRLLSLYRFWNIIQYYNPNKHLMEEDWKNILAEFIPKFINAPNETEYKLAVMELIGRIHDTHANIWSRDEALRKYWGINTLPFEVKFIENKAVVSKYIKNDIAENEGLQIGDVILKINNKPIDTIIHERLKYSPASNYPTQLRTLAQKLLRTNDTLVNFEILRNKKNEVVALKAYPAGEIYSANNQKSDTCFKLINKEISYLNPGYISNDYLPILTKEIENTKGLIIDLRSYPSDFIVFSLSDFLLAKKIPFVRFSNGSIINPGQFILTAPLEVGNTNKNNYKGKVVILINETTQSSAEYHAMAFRASPNAKVIGSTTAGADGNVSQFSLPGGISTMISGIGVLYPNGKETQRVGIIPDIEVKPTIEGFKNNKDEVLERAIKYINTGE